MNRYREIKAFVAVATEGSMAKAAIKEQITSGMLGRRIDDLEKRLGIKLLRRTTRLLTLTEQGRLFLKHCEELLVDLELGETSLFPDTSEVSGQMLVLAPPYFGRQHVAAHAGRFLAANPAVRLSFNLTNDYPDPVQEDYDLCIRIGNVIDPNFVTAKLATNRRVVCATPAYFARYGVPRTLQDLADHNCLAVNLQADRHRDWLFQEGGKLVSVKVDGSMDCSDGGVLVEWARNDHCLSWRSTWEVGASLASGELVSVLDEYALPSFDLTAVYPRNKPSRLARLFIDLLRDIYAEPGYWAHDGALVG
ncbi:LysR family transcriptional regulator [Skermanella stibiiresistens SB22]|uniref:LysR family transcriptional regulator n=1 Tax=Skermanella stibiiresistens SB22 TaxID=1385369 RepID=W9HAJ9_9PROT|nr:LysR family transcriptional regulator [Skermanella stibiiresistens]EWY41712.1 LysR family transcriptional regulator [Skermanella stibiiresistens SB22]